MRSSPPAALFSSPSVGMRCLVLRAALPPCLAGGAVKGVPFSGAPPDPPPDGAAAGFVTPCLAAPVDLATAFFRRATTVHSAAFSPGALLGGAEGPATSGAFSPFPPSDVPGRGAGAFLPPSAGLFEGPGGEVDSEGRGKTGPSGGDGSSCRPSAGNSSSGPSGGDDSSSGPSVGNGSSSGPSGGDGSSSGPSGGDGSSSNGPSGGELGRGAPGHGGGSGSSTSPSFPVTGGSPGEVEQQAAPGDAEQQASPGEARQASLGEARQASLGGARQASLGGARQASLGGARQGRSSSSHDGGCGTSRYSPSAGGGGRGKQSSHGS
ncbi:UNVERIFIED_CONTAM: hypothetical protein FKN15_013972 [Acipenser sinensis]